MATLEEIRARMQANLKLIQDASKAAKPDDKKEDDKEGAAKAKKDAYAKGQDLAVKAHKAVQAMHDHADKSEHVEKAHKDVCASAMKAMKDACKGWGGSAADEAESVDSRQEGGEKAAYGEAMKALGAAQAKLDAAEKLTMLSLVKGGGAGAGLPGADAPTAQKGASAGGGEPFKMPSKAELEKMTDEQRNELALKSVHIDHSIPIPADQFDRTGNEVLMAARKLAEVSA